MRTIENIVIPLLMDFNISPLFSKWLCSRLCRWIILCSYAYCLQLHNQNPLTPLLFHGFINNEHYQHWLPNTRDSELSLASHDVFIKKKSNRQGTTYLKCPIGTTISILKAIYNQTRSSISKNVKKNDKELTVDVTLQTQEICKKNSACRINSSCKLLGTKHICYNNNGNLQLTYTCQTASMEPFPLFNGQTKMYRQGVSPEFLILSGYIGDCHEEKQKKIIAPDLSSLLNNCFGSCQWVQWNEITHHAILCNEEPPGFVQSSHVFPMLQPSITLAVSFNFCTFQSITKLKVKIPGFAVYLNMESFCAHPDLLLEEKEDIGWNDAVMLCRNTTLCQFFVYTPQYTDQKNTHFITRLCQGHPVMIPQSGFITGVVVQKKI